MPLTTAPSVREALLALADDLEREADEWYDAVHDAGIKSGLYIATGRIRALAAEKSERPQRHRALIDEAARELAVMGA
jgi:hypothetical protein